MAVGVVGVEGDVEQDADLGDRGLDRAGGAADQVLGVPGLGGLGVLVGLLGVGEEREAGDAEVGRLLGGADGAVDREAGDAGERGDRLGEVAALADEDRPDQVGGAEPGLGDHGRGSRGCGAAGAGGRAGRGRVGVIGGPRGRSARVWHGAAAPQGKGPFTMRLARGLTRGRPMRPVKGDEPGGPALPRRARPLFQIFAAASFQSLWYWVLHVVVWTLACYRTLGVPHDMLLGRGGCRRSAARVDLLAQLACGAGRRHLRQRSGCRWRRWPGSCSPGSSRSGSSSGIETAQAAFAIMLPFDGDHLLQAAAGAGGAAAADGRAASWCWRWRGGASGTSSSPSPRCSARPALAMALHPRMPLP